MTAEEVDEVDGVGDRGSGDTSMFDVQIVLETFLNMSLRFACLIDEEFFLNGQSIRCMCKGILL